MRKFAFFGVILTGVIALVMVLANSSVSKRGLKLGSRSAAACTKKGPECLPQIGYLDTEDTMWSEELLAGKVVIVNFWATWCAPCRHEVPALTAAYQKYADKGFVLLGVLTDEPTDEELARFASANGLDYPVVRVDQGILDAFQWPNMLPTTFVYDRSGRLRLTHRGPLSERQLDTVLDELMAEEP